MCGFAGFITFGSQQYDQNVRHQVLKTMGSLLEHRGPDDEQIYDDGTLSFVFRRLSIIDVEGGQQPIWNEDKSKFVAINGEIYNHKDLFEQLKQNHTFSTQSDSEVALHLYEDLQQNCLDQLNGMFALIVWDKQNQRLFLARDRLGIKPLYYCYTNNTLLFGSELKALLAHPQCPKQLSWNDLRIVGPQQKTEISSYITGIQHLSGGYYAFFEKGKHFVPRNYWKIDDYLDAAQDNQSQPNDILEQYSEIFEDSVKKRLMSDVPVGLFLSGGIDSSLIAAVAAKHKPDLNCFTVVERTTFLAGDVAQATAVTTKLDLPFHAVHFDLNHFLEASQFDLARFEQLIFMMDSPRFDPEWLFKQELHRYAKSAVTDLKVMLLGQGADEFAGGYSSPLGAKRADWQDYIQTDVMPYLNTCSYTEMDIPEHLQQFTAGYQNISQTHGWNPYQTNMMRFSKQLQHFNLWHEDRSSSSQSIEARVPFLDHRLVELLAQCPPNQHNQLFWDKHIVRHLLAKWLPEYPADKEKVGFYLTDNRASIHQFLHHLLMRIFAAFSDKYLANTNAIFSADKLNRLYASVQAKEPHYIDNTQWLLECMAITIFNTMCQDITKLASQPANHLILNKLSAEELTALDQQYQDLKPPAENEPREWRLDTKVSIPDNVEILMPLIDEDGSQRLILSIDREIRTEISIENRVSWIIAMLEDLTEEKRPFTVSECAENTETTPNNLVGVLDMLVNVGFVQISI